MSLINGVGIFRCARPLAEAGSDFDIRNLGRDLFSDLDRLSFNMTRHDTGVKLAKQARINQVVEELGKLNDRRLLANANNDLAALEQIAQEYNARGMLTMAGELRKAIAIRRKVK